MHSVSLIVSCTDRKKAVIPEGLRLRSLTSDAFARRLERWPDRLVTHDVPPRQAADLDAGDHWQVAQAIPVEAAKSNLDVRLGVCSAGNGLIRRFDMLEPYSATFTPRHPDDTQ